eukprot:744785-Rhodomonas_salina.1
MGCGTVAPLDDGERRAPGGSFKRRQSVPTASKPAKVTIAISEEDGVSAENGGCLLYTSDAADDM